VPDAFFAVRRMQTILDESCRPGIEIVESRLDLDSLAHRPDGCRPTAVAQFERNTDPSPGGTTPMSHFLGA
jgi:hypothetical protein